MLYHSAKTGVMNPIGFYYYLLADYTTCIYIYCINTSGVHRRMGLPTCSMDNIPIAETSWGYMPYSIVKSITDVSTCTW